MSHADRYLRYYVDQQQGKGMDAFRGSPWQVGQGQMGYGLGGLFRSVARSVLPMIKSGAKTLGNIALSSGTNLLGDILAGKNVKKAAKSRFTEATGVVKQKAINKLQSQTGSGKRQPGKRKSKTRKISAATTTSKQAKKRKTTRVEDICHPLWVTVRKSRLQTVR